MAAALAIEHKLDVYYLNLNSITNLDVLNSAILQIGKNSILLVEEIEDVYDGREIKDPNCKVPISGLLNILSGVSHRSDLIIILTSNSIDKLDPALLRPGRIDLFVKYTDPTPELVQEYVNNFYDKSGKIDIKTMPSSMAELENWCIANLHNYDKLINKLTND